MCMCAHIHIFWNMEQSTLERVDFESTRYNNYLLSLLATTIIILDGYQCQSRLVPFFFGNMEQSTFEPVDVWVDSQPQLSLLTCISVSVYVCKYLLKYGAEYTWASRLWVYSLQQLPFVDGYQCQSRLVHFFKKYRVEYTEKVDFWVDLQRQSSSSTCISVGVDVCDLVWNMEQGTLGNFWVWLVVTSHFPQRAR